MIKNKKQTIYKRILLKLSGEYLKGNKSFGIDKIIIKKISQEIKELIKLEIQLGIVIGGGNIFRGDDLSKIGINKITSDNIGMLSTMINGLAINDFLCYYGVNSHVMSAIQINNICDNYNWLKAINLLKNNNVVIFVGGLGNPYFNTDYAAGLRGIEIQAEAILKATQVDGVYSEDPKKNKNAKFYKKINYSDFIKKDLKIIDLKACILTRDQNIPIHVFNINKPGALMNVLLGKQEGTLIYN